MSFLVGGEAQLRIIKTGPDALRVFVLPIIVIHLTASLLTSPLFAETEWCRFTLPRLQPTRPAFSASLVLGLFWAAWHLPVLFYRDTYIVMGLLVIPMLIVVATVGAIVYTWLYNGTRGSLLMVVLFRGLFDFFSVWPAEVIGAGVVTTIMMVFWAVRVDKVYGPADLAPVEKLVI